ncbi:hypothetical protein KBD13_03495 [Patescibacteria group bacterium]|nr:hypothetical protein [Patescibacteria group bacterium]MDQ5919463.1 hypothetical protein [Patescibacteria group bacterium]
MDTDLPRWNREALAREIDLVMSGNAPVVLQRPFGPESPPCEVLLLPTAHQSPQPFRGQAVVRVELAAHIRPHVPDSDGNRSARKVEALKGIRPFLDLTPFGMDTRLYEYLVGESLVTGTPVLDETALAQLLTRLVRVRHVGRAECFSDLALSPHPQNVHVGCEVALAHPLGEVVRYSMYFQMGPAVSSWLCESVAGTEQSNSY